MSAKYLPSRPSVEYYKKQAKQLLKAARAKNPDALGRIKRLHPRLGKLSDANLQTARLLLADAQCVLAREHGFDSWPQMLQHIAALHKTTPATQSAKKETPESAFLEAAIAGNQKEASRILAGHPAIATHNIHVAAMLGEAMVVEQLLKDDPSLATRKGGPKNWDPLLYVSFSRFHRGNKKRAAGIVKSAKLLLAHGANPNTYYRWEQDEKNKLPALWAATAESNHPALARILLEAGANPNDCESVYHCAERFYVECLDLLLSFGAPVNLEDSTYRSTPLWHTVHGSQHCQNPNGDYPAVLEALIASGAKLPDRLYGSDIVRAVLRLHGVE